LVQRKDGDLTMWAMINTLYEEYCEARVEEMRRLEIQILPAC
jgi:hypothetical protein